MLSLHLVMEALLHQVFLSHLQAMEAPNHPLVMATHNQPGVTPALLIQAMVATNLLPAMEAHNQPLVIQLHHHLLAMVAHSLLQGMAVILLLLMEAHNQPLVILLPAMVHSLLQVLATPLAMAILIMALVMAIQAMGDQTLLAMAVQVMEAAQVMELLGDIECMWEICHGQAMMQA